MSDYNLKPLVLKLQPSVGLACGFALFVIGAFICLYITSMQSGLKWVIAILTLLNGVYAILHQALLSLPYSIIQFEIDQKGDCFIMNKGGTRQPVTVHTSSFVANFPTVLNVTRPKKFGLVSMIILPNRVDLEEFRRLRVYLRWAK